MEEVCVPSSACPLPASHLLHSWEHMLLPSGKGHSVQEDLWSGTGAAEPAGVEGTAWGLGGRYSSGKNREHEAKMKYACKT